MGSFLNGIRPNVSVRLYSFDGRFLVGRKGPEGEETIEYHVEVRARSEAGSVQRRQAALARARDRVGGRQLWLGRAVLRLVLCFAERREKKIVRYVDFADARSTYK